MNRACLCGIAMLFASTAFAQTSATPPPPAAAGTPQTVTLTGCVARGSRSEPVTLSNAMVLPFGSPTVAPVPASADASVSPSPETPGAPSTATQLPTPLPPSSPATTAGTTGTLGTIDVGSATIGAGTTGTRGMPGAVGTSGATPGAVGTSGTTSTPGTAGTTEPIAAAATASGTAPAGSSASSIDGYRLTGADMTSWIGRRVEVIGTVVSPAPTAAAATEPRAAAGTPAPPTMPEFRVISVQPVTGPCPR